MYVLQEWDVKSVENPLVSANSFLLASRDYSQTPGGVGGIREGLSSGEGQDCAQKAGERFVAAHPQTGLL